MNILITGGAGFIGLNLSFYLKKLGHRITILDSINKKIHQCRSETLKNLTAFDFIDGDIRNKKIWKSALKYQDAIIHLASETGTGQSMYQMHQYFDVNVNGTAVMLDSLINFKNNISKIIFSSSRAIYGEGRYKCKNCGIVYPHQRLQKDMLNKDFNVKCPNCKNNVSLLATQEKDSANPISIYAITKYTQEKMIINFSKSFSIPSSILRYQNVYGPGQSLINPYTGILSIFTQRILNKKPIYIFEDGKESRDFTYIDDVVNATTLALLSKKADYEIFNVGSGLNISVDDLVTKLMQILKIEVPLIRNYNFRLGDIRHNKANLNKIKKVLNFNHISDIDAGLKKFCNWAISQKVSLDFYDESLNLLKKKGLLK